MYYPQSQSPAITHKLPNHHDQSSWNRSHPVLGPPGSQSVGPPPASPGYAIYTNGNMQHPHAQHHPHSISGHHPPMQHHHQNSLGHYPSTPPNSHMHAQGLGNGSPGSAASQTISPQWQQQLLKCEVRQSFAPIDCRH